VYRNDEFNIDEIAEFDKILLSPGPGYLKKPDTERYHSEIRCYKSILGVCLGQQAIGEVYGGTLSNLEKYTTVLLQWSKR
jgi:anthranilate synthase component 2